MSPHRRANVLIVDDQPENLLALRAVLDPLSVNVIEAGSGEEALKRLLHDDFAVILLDVQMPDMDGFETAELIKRRSKTQDIPIIFLTAIDKEQQKVFRGYSVGAVDYMFKPFDPEVLRSKVSVFVDLYEKSLRLQESEERFRAAFLNAPIGIGLIDADGCWMQVNKALCDIIGRGQSDLVGEHFRGVLVPAEREKAESDLQEVLEGDRVAYQAERQYLHAEGFPVDVLVSVSLARDAEGEPLNFVVQVLDMTERKAAERERGERLQEQAARAEAEAVADTIRKLQTITDVALRHLSLDDLLRGLLAQISDILEVEGAAIGLLDGAGNTLVIEATYGYAQTVDRGFRVALGEGFTGRIAATGRPAVIATAAGVEPLEPFLRQAGIGSLLGVPLRNDGRTIGVLHVGTTRSREFSNEDTSLLQLAADRAALAIEHARSYERERGVVETLQRSLIPEQLPRLPGLEMAARYQPGGPRADVGGDWYDAIALEGGEVGLAMGDVVGHGLEAASLMGQLRNALRAYALEEHPPGVVVEKLDSLVQSLEQGRMATLLYLVVDADLSRIRFASAGHLPPLLVGPDGEAAFIEEAASVPLGVMPGGYDEAVREILPGSTLVLYTDGLVEERGEPIDDGLERLRQAVMDAPDDPEAMCDHVLAAMGRSDRAADDVAMFVLRTVAVAVDEMTLELSTQPRALTGLRRTLGRWLEAAGASSEESQDIRMAAHEAACNSMEHAYGFEEATFKLDASRLDGQVSITVSDTGGWREPRKTDRGRGLELMRALMDDVELEAGDDGTTVRMRRKIGVAQPSKTGDGAAAG
jgi:PAS domain S-box-containing protein